MREGGLHQSGIRAAIFLQIVGKGERRQGISLIPSSGIRYIITMPPRRCVDPPIENRDMEMEMREL
jgi:hypothetical protein